MNRLSLSSIPIVAVLVAALSTPAIASGRPSLAVGAPQNGSVIHGTSLTMHFRVRNFTLVPIGAKAPTHSNVPVGHIQARLDQSPINPATDITASETHTWQRLPAGHHVFTISLANTMNVPVPGVAPATLSFTVRPPAPVHRSPGHRATSPGIGAAPRTGGADGASTPGLNHNLLLTALLALFLGVMLFTVRRLTFGFVDGRSRARNEMESSAGPGTRTENILMTSGPPGKSIPRGTPAAAMASGARIDYDVISGPQDANAYQGARPVIEVEPGPIATRPQQALATSSTQPTPASRDEQSLAQTVEAARKWPEVVQDLARRIEEGATERQRLQERIAILEHTLQETQSLRAALQAAAGDRVNADDLGVVRYVASELVRDPDHIVTLGAVSQYASKVHGVIEEYARLYETLYGNPEVHHEGGSDTQQ